jgi:hypothetical protein
VDDMKRSFIVLKFKCSQYFYTQPGLFLHDELNDESEIIYH